MPALELHIHDTAELDIVQLDAVQIPLVNKPLEERVKWLILRDLSNVNWTITLPTHDNPKLMINPPEAYDKETIKQSMGVKRSEVIRKNKTWIENHIGIARANLANGRDVLKSRIKPSFEVCETPKQHALFRIFRYYWSSPYSDYVGRRIKIIIRDEGLPNRPVIGIAALGSPIIHIPERDEWIGWDIKTRTKNLVYTMDAYIIGALPPYNEILGGKLISYLLASDELRKIYEEKYKDTITLKEKRTACELAGIFTTSLYGNSSQYNRLNYRDRVLYEHIGKTKGFGTLHLSQETINAMISYLKSQNINITNKFGDGPSWTMRVIREAGERLGFDAEFLLKHSFKRNIYFVSLAKNSVAFLGGNQSRLVPYNYPMKSLVNYWKKRWLNNRKMKLEIINKVVSFTPADFEIQ